MAGDERLGRQEGSTGSVPDRCRHGEEANLALGEEPDPAPGRTRLELELDSGRRADVVRELRPHVPPRPATALSRPSAANRPRRPLADTTAVRPAQLPAAVADFTGREDLVRKLNDRLAASADRPAAIAIAGIGGIGKTALAVHLAHTARHRFPDGQLYV
ncbi:hypothetical protein JBE27_38145, partial [Streptomyces albiflaviniger]|nr:hypothetical protein [Streptomyces albiflaviniger]